MAPLGFTTKALVAAELGKTFTAPQDTQCDGLIEEAEAYIRRRTGRVWLVTSPATAETHGVARGLVYLSRTPVTAVTAVTVRSRAIGAVATALVAGVSYELFDAVRGIVSVGDYSEDVLISVTYTHGSPLPVPGDIQRAATLLVARWMLSRLNPDWAGLKSYSVGGELSVTMQDAASPSADGEVEKILLGYRALVLA